MGAEGIMGGPYLLEDIPILRATLRHFRNLSDFRQFDFNKPGEPERPLRLRVVERTLPWREDSWVMRSLRRGIDLDKKRLDPVILESVRARNSQSQNLRPLINEREVPLAEVDREGRLKKDAVDLGADVIVSMFLPGYDARSPAKAYVFFGFNDRGIHGGGGGFFELNRNKGAWSVVYQKLYFIE